MGRSSSCFGLNERTYVVADHSVADTIFGTHEAFTKYPHHTTDLAKLQALIGKGMLATHTDQEWASHRQSMARSFSKTATLKNFSDIVLRHVNSLLNEALASGSHLSNISELAMRLSGRIMSDVLVASNTFTDKNFLEIKRLLDESSYISIAGTSSDVLGPTKWRFASRPRFWLKRLRQEVKMKVCYER